MGGSAFASSDGGHPALLTPRMPLSIYRLVKIRCQAVLSKAFEHVTTPIEAPGKTTYGDVDMLVACPTPFVSGLDIMDTLEGALGAVRKRREGPITSFAVPWPESEESRVVEPGEDVLFVQVDVHLCDDEEGWVWERFHSAHGDLWNMLGSTIRKFGLTVNSVGFFLRIPEIELLDKKKSLVFLTKSPQEVLEFLNLNYEKWWKQFESEDEMFQYAAGCRMFWVAEKVEEGADKKKLKHNDRQRMAQRPLFRRWIEEFIPKCRAEGTYKHISLDRVSITNEALDRFNVRDEYETRLKVWSKDRQRDEVWRDIIKGGVPIDDPQRKSVTVKELKAIILEDDYRSGVIPQKPLKKEDGLFDIDAVIDFVSCNWREVGDIAWRNQQIRAREIMKNKETMRALAAAKRD